MTSGMVKRPHGGTDGGPITVAAPAKLNLALHVVGRRADGFHVLESVVAFALVHDTITVSPSPEFDLTVDGPFAKVLEEEADRNLVIRAARALAAIASWPSGAAIRLTKRLPVASGIGGGSSDAAATLRALAELWELAPSTIENPEITAALGADVPVCVSARTAMMTGVGERVTPLSPVPTVPVVLANPGVPVSTPAVFGARRATFRPRGLVPPAAVTAGGLARWIGETANDLTEPAMAVEPAVADVLEHLNALPGALVARLSGSGATAFALFETAAAATAAARHLAAARPGWWIRQSWIVGDARAVLA